MEMSTAIQFKLGSSCRSCFVYADVIINGPKIRKERAWRNMAKHALVSHNQWLAEVANINDHADPLSLPSRRNRSR